MMLTFIRFLLLLLLGFTFGGFLFYASVVVPLGTSILGSTTQGFVTRSVTNVINVASLVSALAIAAYAWTTSNRFRTEDSIRIPLVSACIIGTTAIILMWLHGHLEQAMADDEFAVMDGESFYRTHRVYLWVSTIQWLSSLPVLWWFARPVRIDAS
ncbi:MAG: hypothetical protein AAGG44_01525 [Planctomycetota bacterium]